MAESPHTSYRIRHGSIATYSNNLDKLFEMAIAQKMLENKYFIEQMVMEKWKVIAGKNAYRSKYRLNWWCMRKVDERKIGFLYLADVIDFIINKNLDKNEYRVFQYYYGDWHPILGDLEIN